jgi:putative ABC transport system permease protein
MIKNHFKIAWRNLWKHKRMTFINVAGLGIGMAATVLIVMWVQNELSFDRFEPDSGNIYRIKASIGITKTETWQWENSQYILGEHAKKEIPEVTDLARLQSHYGDLNMHLGDKIITAKNAAFVDEHWFNLFHYDFVEGSADEFVKNPFSLIITQSAAKSYFGTQDAIGKVLRIDTNNYRVQAVVKDYPTNSSFRYDVLMPVAARLANPEQKKNDLEWGNYEYLTFLKLRPDAKPGAVAAKLLSILRSNRKKDNGKSKYSLVRLPDIHFENDLMNSSLVHGNRTIVNVFIVLAALLLATACINYVNLTTARASLRSKEVSVRKIVGAGRPHLFGQFMSESLVVSIISLLLALVLIELCMPWFRTFTAKDFAEPLATPATWTILISTLLISFLLNGIYPAFLLSSFKPLNVFRGKSMLNFKDSTLRRVLVVTQFTISVVLIVGTLVIYRQLNYMETTNPGYNRSQVFSFSFPWWKIPHLDFKKADQFVQTVKQQLQSRAATANVAMGGSDLVNFNSSSSGNFDWPGRPKDFEPSFAPLGVDVDFERLMQLKITEGRWFNNDVADKRNVLLNETAVKLINLHGDPVGQRFTHQGDTGVIIGIVKDFHFRSLHDKIGPMIISQNNTSGFYIKTAPGNNAAAILAAGKIWKQYFPDAPFDYVFLDDAYNNLYQAEQQQSVLITVFAVIAIFISALGLLGLAAFAAEQKVKEIGIRKVLGASVQHIVRLLSVDFVIMVCIASIIAFPVAYWAMNKWLQSFAYRIDLSWWIFACAAAIALLIAFITVSFQSVKAALANPVNSLRSE